MGRFLRALFLAGALGGTGDLLFAMSFAWSRGTPPLTLLQIVASGAFGEGALSGGLPMAALGLGGHFLLATAWAALGLLGLVRLRTTLPSIVLAIGFGLAVFLVMRLVVLPLSAYPYPVTFKPGPTVLDALSHVFLFALPVVLVGRRLLSEETARPR